MGTHRDEDHLCKNESRDEKKKLLWEDAIGVSVLKYPPEVGAKQDRCIILKGKFSVLVALSGMWLHVVTTPDSLLSAVAQSSH